MAGEATFDELKAAKLCEINMAAQSMVASVTTAYPPFEVLTWPSQTSEVIAWQEDSTAPTPTCDLICERRGLERTDFLNRTLAKVLQFREIASAVAGERQKLEDEVGALAEDTEENRAALAAIAWVLTPADIQA